jgi:hypothetical protein
MNMISCCHCPASVKINGKCLYLCTVCEKFMCLDCQDKHKCEKIYKKICKCPNDQYCAICIKAFLNK